MLRTEKLLSRPHPASFAKVYRAIRTWTEKNVVKSILAIETPGSAAGSEHGGEMAHGYQRHTPWGLTPAIVLITLRRRIGLERQCVTKS